LELDVCSAQISSISIDDQFTTLSTLSQDNVIALFELPEILCSYVFDLEDEKHAYGCSLSSSNRFVSALFEKQVQIFKLAEEKVKKIAIKKFSPYVWHPTTDILCYVAEKDDDNITLIKL
jgi:hypothetical protein